MELRHIAANNRSRLVCAVAAIALVLASVIALAGRAQADPDPSGGGDRARSAPARMDDPKNRFLAARSGRARHAPAEDAKTLPEVREDGESLSLTDAACRRNVGRAASRGLRLPDSWEIHCVGPGLDWEGGSHWGVTCPYEDCPEGNGPYVSISNPTYYVVAHELCHANFGNDELRADACAAEHGASLESSPYS